MANGLKGVEVGLAVGREGGPVECRTDFCRCIVATTWTCVFVSRQRPPCLIAVVRGGRGGGWRGIHGQPRCVPMIEGLGRGEGAAGFYSFKASSFERFDEHTRQTAALGRPRRAPCQEMFGAAPVFASRAVDK